MKNTLKDFSAGAESATSVNAEQSKDSTKKSRKLGLRNLAITLIGSFTVYAALFFGLSLWAEIPFGWSIFLGYAVGMVVFAYLDAVFKSTSENGWPIFLLMTIILVISLAVHYLSDENSGNTFSDTDYSNVELVVKSENGIIKKVGQNWTTDKIFTAGSSALVKIRGAAVRMADGDLLSPSDYSIKVTENEPLSFTATENITTTIEVIY